MKRILEKLHALRFRLCDFFKTNAFYTPNERAFFRELDEMVERITREGK
jgi:hypothetical protein